MIFAIDHIVFAATTAERDAITATLEPRGFTRQAFTLKFPEVGASSESWSFGGGGFIEFVGPDPDAAAAPAGAAAGLPWFDETPRVIGLGFASDAFAADTPWRDSDEGWVMDEHHTLPTGADLRIHAAGPHEHRSDFYVFVMDRPEGTLEFGPPAGGPRLTHVTLTGAAAGWWREHLAMWLGLHAGDDTTALHVGDVTFAFESSDAPSVRATLGFASGAGQPLRVSLSPGAIEVD
jgi:hypothetical protein